MPIPGEDDYYFDAERTFMPEYWQGQQRDPEVRTDYVNADWDSDFTDWRDAVNNGAFNLFVGDKAASDAYAMEQGQRSGSQVSGVQNGLAIADYDENGEPILVNPYLLDDVTVKGTNLAPVKAARERPDYKQLNRFMQIAPLGINFFAPEVAGYIADGVTRTLTDGKSQNFGQAIANATGTEDSTLFGLPASTYWQFLNPGYMLGAGVGFDRYGNLLGHSLSGLKAELGPVLSPLASKIGQAVKSKVSDGYQSAKDWFRFGKKPVEPAGEPFMERPLTINQGPVAEAVSAPDPFFDAPSQPRQVSAPDPFQVAETIPEIAPNGAKIRKPLTTVADPNLGRFEVQLKDGTKLDFSDYLEPWRRDNRIPTKEDYETLAFYMPELQQIAKKYSLNELNDFGVDPRQILQARVHGEVIPGGQFAISGMPSDYGSPVLNSVNEFGSPFKIWGGSPAMAESNILSKITPDNRFVRYVADLAKKGNPISPYFDLYKATKDEGFKSLINPFGLKEGESAIDYILNRHLHNPVIKKATKEVFDSHPDISYKTKNMLGGIGMDPYRYNQAIIEIRQAKNELRELLDSWQSVFSKAVETGQEELALKYVPDFVESLNLNSLFNSSLANKYNFLELLNADPRLDDALQKALRPGLILNKIPVNEYSSASLGEILEDIAQMKNRVDSIDKAANSMPIATAPENYKSRLMEFLRKERPALTARMGEPIHEDIDRVVQSIARFPEARRDFNNYVYKNLKEFAETGKDIPKTTASHGPVRYVFSPMEAYDLKTGSMPTKGVFDANYQLWRKLYKDDPMFGIESFKRADRDPDVHIPAVEERYLYEGGNYDNADRVVARLFNDNPDRGSVMLKSIIEGQKKPNPFYILNDIIQRSDMPRISYPNSGGFNGGLGTDSYDSWLLPFLGPTALLYANGLSGSNEEQ